MRIRELDGLRGIAVLAVIAQHYFTWLPISLFHYGWLGVDLFFILSGFLITTILVELRTSEHYFRVFYARRALRIFPPYYLALVIYLTSSIALGLAIPWRFWLQYFFYYKSLFLSQSDLAHIAPSGTPLFLIGGLTVLWSLSVEEVYYTIWAPIVRFTSQKIFSLLLLAMILIAPLLRILFHTPAWPENITFYCRMDGLAYGSAVALLVLFRHTHPTHWLSHDRLINRLTLIIPLVTIAFWILAAQTPASGTLNSLGISLSDLSFALITYALIRYSGSSSIYVRFFRNKVLRSIGMVSYTMYLCHYPLYRIAMPLVSGLNVNNHMRAILADCLGLVMTFIVSYSMWYLVESRILLWKDRIVPSRPKTT